MAKHKQLIKKEDRLFCLDKTKYGRQGPQTVLAGDRLLPPLSSTSCCMETYQGFSNRKNKPAWLLVAEGWLPPLCMLASNLIVVDATARCFVAVVHKGASYSVVVKGN